MPSYLDQFLPSGRGGNPSIRYTGYSPVNTSYSPYNPLETGGNGMYGNKNTIGGSTPSWLVPLIGGLFSLGGSALTARSQNKAAAAQNTRTAGIDTDIDALIASLSGGKGGIYDDLLNSYKNNGAAVDMQVPDLIPNLYRDLGLATDPIIQALRAGGPNDAMVSQNLQGLLETGNPFDTSIISASLDPLRRRNTALAMGDLQAGAAGLGQRFGSAQLRSAQELQRQAIEDAGAQDSQLLFAGHESAQARRLQAAGLFNDMSQNDTQRNLGAINALISQAGVGNAENANRLGLGNLNLDKSKLALATQSEKDQVAQALLNNDTARAQQILQALGLKYGQPVASGPGYGGVAGDAGQLALLYWLYGQGGKQT